MTGDRIKQARLIANLTHEQVIERLQAKGVELTVEELAAFERNEKFPRPTLSRQLASVLGTYPAYFMQQPSVRVTWVAFRKTPQLTEMQAERIQAFAQDRAEKQAELQLELYPLEEMPFPQPILVRTAQDAERAADYLRKQWDLGTRPIESVAQTFEDHGGILLFWEQDQGEFDGLSGWANEALPIAVVNNGSSVERRRFNLAHELGHMIMHSDDLPNVEQEQLAQRFAAAFLVPAKAAIHDLGAKRREINWEELAFLKEKYGMSLQAWIRRAHELGIIDDAARDKLFQDMRTKDPTPPSVKKLVRDEEPRRLRQMVLHAFSETIIPLELALELCPGSIQIDYQRPPLPPGRKYTAQEFLKLPAEERAKVWAEIPQEAIDAYNADEDLNAFRMICDDFIE